MRVFEDTESRRAAVQLLIGLVGPSFSGKTMSALRLATGIQRVTGGDIFYIDTEARRALHYADAYRFRHVEFRAPFGPLDYMAALEHCVKKGASVIVVDSMSHEHEGPGGVLEKHAEELDRLTGGDVKKIHKMTMLAWQRPKRERRRMINTILQLPVNVIFCFRAKEKLRLERGKDPEPLGFMAIAGEELVFEMTVSCLLMPGAGGVPSWSSDEIGERMMMKAPDYLRDLLIGRDSPLDESLGEALARWAAGGSEAFTRLTAAIAAATTPEELAPAGREVKAIPTSKAATPDEHKALLAQVRARLASFAAAAAPSEPDEDPMPGYPYGEKAPDADGDGR